MMQKDSVPLTNKAATSPKRTPVMVATSSLRNKDLRVYLPHGLFGFCLLVIGAAFCLPSAGPSNTRTELRAVAPSMVRGVPTSVRPNTAVRPNTVALRADNDVESFREKLMDGAISGRRMEKWTTKGRQSKLQKEQAREAAREAAENPGMFNDEFDDFDDEFDDEFEPVDVTTEDSFAFGDADMERQDMQPANELEELRAKAFANWPEKGAEFFAQKMATVFFGVLAFLMLWIAVSDNNIEIVGVTYAVLITSAFTSAFLFSLWIDWKYVGDRLKDPKVYYEKSGWYDGDLWEKPPAVAQRDALLYREVITPVLDLLMPFLKGSLALTAAMFLLLQVVRPADPDTFFTADDGKQYSIYKQATYRSSAYEDPEELEE